MERSEVQLKIIWRLFFLLLFLLPSPGLAQFKEIIAEGTYNMGDGETPTVAEERALLNAKRTAMEQAGTYIQSYSKVKNFQLSHDEIQLFASGVMEVIVLDKKRSIEADGFKFWVKIKAKVSTDKIEEMVRSVKDRSEVEDYKRVQASYDKLAKDIELLKKELKDSKSQQEKKRIEGKIANEERQFQVKTWYEKGKIQVLNRKYDDAIESFNAAIGLDPNYVQAYSGRGAVFVVKHQLEKSLEDLNKAIAIDPYFAKAYNNRGIVYLQQKEYESALEDLNKAISIDPNLAEPYSNRGLVYFRKGEYERAFEDINKAISIDPKLAKPYLARGFGYYMKRQIEKSLEDLDKAVSMDPNLAEAYSIRGLLYIEKHENERAFADLNKAITLDPNLVLAYVNRSLAHSQSGNPQRAIEDSNKAIELDPKNALAYISRSSA